MQDKEQNSSTCKVEEKGKQKEQRNNRERRMYNEKNKDK
jgi:hypothetical protein